MRGIDNAEVTGRQGGRSTAPSGAGMRATRQRSAPKQNSVSGSTTARSQRVTEELGHTDILDALAHAKEMRSALSVIHTWASVPNALHAAHVRELTANALHLPDAATRVKK